jgi:hypothetical protein
MLLTVINTHNEHSREVQIKVNPSALKYVTRSRDDQLGKAVARFMHVPGLISSPLEPSDFLQELNISAVQLKVWDSSGVNNEVDCFINPGSVVCSQKNGDRSNHTIYFADGDRIKVMNDNGL